MDQDAPTPDPDYQPQRPRGRTDEERAAFWTKLIEQEERRRRPLEIAWLALEVSLQMAAVLAVAAGGIVLLSGVFAALVAWPVPTLLLAIFVVLVVIAVLLSRRQGT